MRAKLKRFEENELRDNVLQPGKDLYEEIKGVWESSQYNN